MRVHHADRFLPPTPGTAAICVIHSASWRSSRSFTGSSCTPRVDLPIPTGVAGGTGVSDAPFTNMSLTWPAKPPQQKHQPSPTPSYDGPTSRSAAGREASCPRGHRHVRRCHAAAAAGSRCTQRPAGVLAPVSCTLPPNENGSYTCRGPGLASCTSTPTSLSRRPFASVISQACRSRRSRPRWPSIPSCCRSGGRTYVRGSSAGER